MGKQVEGISKYELPDIKVASGCQVQHGSAVDAVESLCAVPGGGWTARGLLCKLYTCLINQYTVHLR